MILFSEKQPNSHQEIDEVKNQIIDNSLIIGSVLGLFSFLASLKFNLQNNYFVFICLDFSIVISLFIVASFRKRLPVPLKSFIILLCLFILALSSILKIGVFADSKVLIILIPLFALFSYSLRNTIIIYSLAIVGFIVLGYLYISGTIDTYANLPQRAVSISAWVNNVFLISIVSIIILIIVLKFNKAFLKLINDLKIKNNEIAEKERNYREIFNSSTDAIFILDLNGKILDVNRSMLNMYGYNIEESTSINFDSLNSGSSPYAKDKIENYFWKARRGKLQVFDWHSCKKNGDTFWVEVSMKKISVGDSERILVVIKDINERKQNALELVKYRNDLELMVKERTQELEITLNNLRNTQEQLIQSEKMASLGVLAAGVAHEINNPLNFIQGGINCIEICLENDTDNKTLKQIAPYAKAIKEGVKRASNIVLGLNHFSRKDSASTVECDIHSIINNCLIILNNKLKHKVDIIKNYTTKPFILKGNEGKIHQTILNILSNAEQAIEKEGTIEISTSIEEQNLKIVIKDSGCGISKDIISKISDPFFTTKEVGKGTGLGLSIAYKIIQEHNGTITHLSPDEKGTETIITLPLEA